MVIHEAERRTVMRSCALNERVMRRVALGESHSITLKKRTVNPRVMGGWGGTARMNDCTGNDAYISDRGDDRENPPY
jgi:hypothetical protein